MTKELAKEYAYKLKEISENKKFIVGQMIGLYGDEHIKHMLDYINSHPKCKEADVIIEDIKYEKEYKRKRYVSAIMGLVVGDALGVPVEFMSREDLKSNPVRGMRGYGTYNQPPGTWSDDSSMVVATMEWIVETKEPPLDYVQLMDKFSQWLMYGEYTPYGDTFDCGISTNRAIMNYGRGMQPTECGGKTEYDNGNGSLMRILPMALWNASELAGEEIFQLDCIYDTSSLTHAHARSKAGCLLYSKMIADLLHMPDEDKHKTIKYSIDSFRKYLSGEQDVEIVSEAERYSRIWELDSFVALPETAINSSGYIVDTLEAALWCFLTTDSYKECVLKAVNLGNDTDTVAAVAGGLAGLYYGFENIPQEWVGLIPRKEWIIDLATAMVS